MQPPLTRRNTLLIVFYFIFFAGFAKAENWPQFRGPAGMGLATEKLLPIEWGGKENKNVLWHSDLPGEGHASPIVWGDRVFVCTVTWTENAADRKSIPRIM